MKLSDLELTAYDLAVIILPGSLALAEIGISLKGFFPIWNGLEKISISLAITLLMVAFAFGHLVSQAAYELARLLAGDRFFFASRDSYWKKNHTEIRERLLDRYKLTVIADDQASEDKAFNYCLTILGKSFEKRRIFVLVAALSLSLWFLSLTALIPACISIFRGFHDLRSALCRSALDLVVCSLFSILAWRRMQLYSGLADITVFHTFMALQENAERTAAPRETPSEDGDEEEYMGYEEKNVDDK